MHILKTTVKRVEDLEKIFTGDDLPLILMPNEDGTFTAYDQHHKGRIYDQERIKSHKGPCIIWGR